MNKRFFLALILTAIVIVVTPLVFPTAVRRVGPNQTADSVTKASAPKQPVTVTAQPTLPEPINGINSSIPQLTRPVNPGDTLALQTAHARYTFSAHGGVPTSIVLDSYPSLRPDARGRKAELVGPREALLRYRLTLGRDTIALDTIALRAEQKNEAAGPSVVFTGTVAGHALRLNYQFAPDIADDFLIHVSATVENAVPGSGLLIQLPRTIHSNEADTLDDLNHLAVSYRPAIGDVKSVNFSKLDSTESIITPGPINWVATRDKYFLTVFRSTKTPFSVLALHGAPRQGKIAAEIGGMVALPLNAEGTAAFEIYAGPQNFERLQRLDTTFLALRLGEHLGLLRCRSERVHHRFRIN
ncbi:MAG: YidC/Oxa1 family insertase periplasmic-domain containing protein [Betaproteobacteria bacterium]